MSSDGAAEAPPDAGRDAPWDGGAPSAEAGADVAVQAVSDAAREALAPPIEIPVAGECGAPGGPTCPVKYEGSVAIATYSSSGLSLAMTPGGALYLAGGFNKEVDFDPTAAGTDVRRPLVSSDAFITRFGPTGTYEQTVTFAGVGQWGAGVWGLAATDDALFAAGGFTQSIDLDPGPGVDERSTPEDADRDGAFLVKLSSAGALSWGRTLVHATGEYVGWGLVRAAPDGGAFLTGSYRGATIDLDPGPGTRAAPNGMGGFVMRVDAAGQLVWVRTFGGDQDTCERAEIGGLDLAPDGTPRIAGTFAGVCRFDQGGPETMGKGMFVATIAGDGKLGGVSFLLGRFNVDTFAVGPDGSSFVGGNVGWEGPADETIVDFDPSASVASRAFRGPEAAHFILALDAGRGFRWVDLLDPLVATVVAGLPDGGVLVAGGGPTLQPAMALVRLDAAGHEVWRQFAGSRYTGAVALSVTATGFVVAGEQSSSSDLDPSAGVDLFGAQISFASRYSF